MTIHKPKL